MRPHPPAPALFSTPALHRVRLGREGPRGAATLRSVLCAGPRSGWGRGAGPERARTGDAAAAGSDVGTADEQAGPRGPGSERGRYRRGAAAGGGTPSARRFPNRPRARPRPNPGEPGRVPGQGPGGLTCCTELFSGTANSSFSFGVFTVTFMIFGSAEAPAGAEPSAAAALSCELGAPPLSPLSAMAALTQSRRRGRASRKGFGRGRERAAPPQGPPARRRRGVRIPRGSRYAPA